MQQQIDIEIIEKAQKQDKQAFGKLILYYQKYIYSLVFRMLCNEADARDVVQETFIKIWKHLGDYKIDTKFSTWIYKITINTCLDKLRQRKRNRFIINGIEAEKEFRKIFTNEGERRLSNSGIIEIIKQLTEKLSPKQKAVFVLRDLDDMEMNEISEITGLSMDNVKSNLCFARQKMREFLKQYEL